MKLRRAILPVLLLTARTVTAQHADSLLAIGSDNTRSNQERVEAVRLLTFAYGLTAGDILAAPNVSDLLGDTLQDTGDGAWAWVLQGHILFRRSDYKASLRAYEKALQLFGKHHDEHGSTLASRDKANVLNLLGDQAGAMRLYFATLEKLRRNGPRLEEGRVLLDLAWIFQFQQDPGKAREYQLEAMTIARSLGARFLIADALRVEGDGLMDSARLKEAEYRYQQALDIYTELGGKGKVAILSTALSNVRIELGDLPGAHRALLIALKAFEEADNAIWTSYLLSRLAHVSHLQHRDVAARDYALRGLKVAGEHGLLKETADNLEKLPAISATLGDYRNALLYSRRYEATMDSLIKNSIAAEMAQIDQRQEQVRDSLLREEQRLRASGAYQASVLKATRQRNLILFASIGVLMVSGGLWNRLRTTTRVRRELAAGNALIEEEKLRAERSEKVKEQFLANMSHEIRTPMNAIMGMTGILRRNERLPAQEKYLDAIAQSSENLLVILNDILDLDRLEAGSVELEKVVFAPGKVLGNVVDILRFKAEEKGLELGMRVAADVPERVIGDPTRLHQILLNLAGNAVKFTEKGRVMIDLVVEQQETERAVLCFVVTDTGIGIPADKLEGIFEEFTQAYSDTTRKYGGTGLGLTISKRYVELQGGTIAVESVKNEGSTFTVLIPYAIGATENDQRAAGNALAELNGLRILLAEDNEFNVMVAQDELTDAIPNVHIDVAPNGRIAVEMVQTNSYDVVLMDIQMPEMNGFEATQAIRALANEKSRVPIIAITANVLKSEVDKCMAAGMNGFVPKPFERKDLLANLRSAMATRTTGT